MSTSRLSAYLMTFTAFVILTLTPTPGIAQHGGGGHGGGGGGGGFHGGSSGGGYHGGGFMAAGLTAASDLLREAGKAAAIAVIQDQDRMPMEPKATAMAGTVLRAA